MQPAHLKSLIACHECDLLQDRPTLEVGQVARCARCGSKMYAEYQDDVQRALAYTVGGGLLFMVMVSFPFLGISVAGIERKVSLFGSVMALYDDHSAFLAVLTGMLLIVFPMIKVIGLIAILLPLSIERRIPSVHIWCRLVERIIPWNMTEIYLVGVLVTFVKLSSMANIIYGVAFWAFIGFVVAMTAARASIHFTTLWSKLERA